MDGYDAYECPCGGTGQSNDPTLRDLATPTASHRQCPYCKGFGAIYILAGFRPPDYAGKQVIA